MKTKQVAFKIALLFFVMLFSFSACKKRQAFNDEDGQTSIDNRNVQGENDAAVSDVNDVISNQPSLRGRGESVMGIKGVTGTLCGVTVDTLSLGAGSVKLNYNGTTCGNRTRTGSIKLTIVNFAAGKRWKQPNCELKVEYLSYKITRASDGKSIELNGTQTITNETGGSWWELLITKTQSSLATSIKGTDLKVTFDDGKTASYNINRRFTYTVPGGIITCTGEGIGSLNGINNLENYGLTRNGDEFTSQVTTPIVWNLTCGPWAPVKGEVNIKVDSKSFDLKCLFAVDASGNSVDAGVNSCPYGWKVEWKYKRKTNKKIIPYG
ncbi:MAG TPA: hypothetical protein PL029_07225 [Bacteroidia bacterium]|nr:hypothetical protein [Bacteroidia bacterium]